jgi:hypothetical protein
MRIVVGLLTLALVLVSAALLGSGPATAFARLAQPGTAQSLVLDAKIVCGDFGNGYTCRREGGAIRRGKNIKVPGGGSDSSSGSEGGLFGGGGWFGGGSDDADALPPPPGDGTSAPPSTTAASCPANTELLGGHCIPYTQSCRSGLAAGAAPQVCANVEEKLICNFRSDGLKDCCCRTYSKF